MSKIKSFFRACWSWLRKYIFNKKSIIPALIAEFIFWSPVIICLILGIFYPRFTAIGIGIFIFWANPLTPATLVQVSLITAVVGLWNKIRIKKSNKKKD